MPEEINSAGIIDKACVIAWLIVQNLSCTTEKRKIRGGRIYFRAAFLSLLFNRINGTIKVKQKYQ